VTDEAFVTFFDDYPKINLKDMSVFTEEGEGIGKVIINNRNTGLATVQIDKIFEKKPLYSI
jgi:hypothetical protein